MITLFTAKSGRTSARADDKIIHSTYDPAREARRFVTEKLKKRAASVIILGTGLGYIHDAVREKFPEAKIISVSYSPELYKEIAESCSDKCIYFEDPLVFYRKLLSLLLPSDIDGLLVLEWPVLAELFPEKSGSAHGMIQQALKELQADFATTSHFGRRWVTNCVDNFLNLDSVSRLPEVWTEYPLVVAASGPSLELQLDLIRECRNRIVLWALPSSLAALSHAGISPDLVVSTDAGFYSRINFHYIPPVLPAVASPLSAVPVHRVSGFRRVLLNQGTFFESTFVEGPVPYFYRIGENGTAAGSALETAVVQGYSRIIFAGLDFAFADIQEHVKPHPFDLLFLTTSNRTDPVYHKIFSRAFQLSDRSEGLSRGSYAYSIYASWFDTVAPAVDASVSRLGPVPFPVGGLSTLNQDEFITLLPQASRSMNSGWKDAPLPGTQARRVLVADTVRSWTTMISQYRSYPLDTAIAFLRARNLFHKLLYTYDPLLVKMTIKHFLENDRNTSSLFFDRLVTEAVDFYGSLLYRNPITDGT